MTIKAIETRYAGCRFRSRLEARWAVFFDHMGIPWEYEPEGFETPFGNYLPDFRLSTPKGTPVFWVEIKGGVPTENDLSRGAFVSDETRIAFSVLWGEVPRSLDRAESGAEGLAVFHHHPGEPDTFRGTWKFCQHHVSLVEKALVAARSARFEFGESG